MARLPAVDEVASLSDEARKVLDQVAGYRGNVRGPIGVVMPYAPEVAARLAHLGNALRFESGFSKAQVELATIVASRAANATYPWAAHVPAAREAGVPEATVAAVDARGPLDGLPADDALIVQYGRELLEDRKLSQATFDKARARFGEKGLMELTALMGYYTMIACIIVAIDLQPALDRPRLSSLGS